MLEPPAPLLPVFAVPPAPLLLVPLLPVPLLPVFGVSGAPFAPFCSLPFVDGTAGGALPFVFEPVAPVEPAAPAAAPFPG
jgi:hypothetical protein